MAHTVREKAKLIARVRRIRGQVEGLERALEAHKGCAEVLLQIAAVRGAVGALMLQVIEEHVLNHVASPSIASDTQRAEAADELIEVIRAYLK